MPYTYKSIACLWFITIGLFVLTGSGVATGPWLLVLVAIGLAAPALILTSPSPVGVTTPSHERARVVSDERARSPLDFCKVDVYRWENEGGARRMPFNGRVPEPADAAG